MFNGIDDRKHAFASLSLRNPLEARDLFHVHLMKKRNAVATANLGAIGQDDLVQLYTRHDFVPSFTLDKIKPVLLNPGGAHAPITRTHAGPAHRGNAAAASVRVPRTPHGDLIPTRRARNGEGH